MRSARPAAVEWLIAAVAMDRIGPRRVVPIGAAAVGVGALMFASRNAGLANAGRFLRGAGGVFALVGAAYIATTSFPPSRAATLIGATQMFGMFLPAPAARVPVRDRGPGAMRALGIVFRNPQSILFGIIAGLIFIPTTIFEPVAASGRGHAARAGAPSVALVTP